MLEIQQIRIFPDPVLKTPSLPLAKPDNNLARLLRQAAPENALGLAAPQIGILRQGILWKNEDNEEILWNPEITGYGEKIIGIEGCLSLPGESWEVTRWERVKLTARGEGWQTVAREVSGLPARIIQHEVDHLRGILISDIGERID